MCSDWKKYIFHKICNWKFLILGANYLKYVTLKIPGAGAEGTVPKYTYKHADIRPWDVRNDLVQYERDYVICTKTRHVT